MDGEKMITINEAARILNVQKETVRRYIKNGLLIALTLPGGDYRLREQDLQQLLKGHLKDGQGNR